MTTVFVVTAKIRYMWERETRTEVIGVALSREGASQLENAAKERPEVMDIDTETTELVE